MSALVEIAFIWTGISAPARMDGFWMIEIDARSSSGRKGEPMDDLISRRTAVELIHSMYPSAPILRKNRELWKKKYEPYIEAEKALEQMPSAQPDLDEWCTDCKEYDQERHCCPRWNRVIRQALKDAQPEIIRCKDCKYYIKSESYCDYLGITISDLDFCSLAGRRTDD